MSGEPVQINMVCVLKALAISSAFISSFPLSIGVMYKAAVLFHAAVMLVLTWGMHVSCGSLHIDPTG